MSRTKPSAVLAVICCSLSDLFEGAHPALAHRRSDSRTCLPIRVVRLSVKTLPLPGCHTGSRAGDPGRRGSCHPASIGTLHRVGNSTLGPPSPHSNTRPALRPAHIDPKDRVAVWSCAVEFKAGRERDLHEPRISEPFERAVEDRPATPYIEALLNEKLGWEHRLKDALTTAALVDVSE